MFGFVKLESASLLHPFCIYTKHCSSVNINIPILLHIIRISEFNTGVNMIYYISPHYSIMAKHC